MSEQPHECPAAPLPEEGKPPIPCSLADVRTGSEMIRMITECTRCGWVDPAALDRWAEQVIKERLDAAAKAVALAASGEPFAFVQYDGNPLDLRAAVSQALGAASMCWTEPPTGVINSDRAAEVYRNLMAFVAEWHREGFHVTHSHGQHTSHTHTWDEYKKHQRPVFDEQLQ